MIRASLLDGQFDLAADGAATVGQSYFLISAAMLSA